MAGNFLIQATNLVQAQTTANALDFYPVLLANGLQQVTGVQQVIQTLLAALTVQQGSIYRAREYGTSLPNTLFEPLDNTTLENLINTLANDLSLSVPDVKFNLTDVVADPTTQSVTLTLNVVFLDQTYITTQTISINNLRVF